jgi:hypothetical protein
MAEWARTTATTIRDFAYGFEQTIMRKQIILAKLKSKGRIKLNCTGDGHQWQPLYQRGSVVEDGGERVSVFQQVNPFQKAYLDVGGYEVTDAMSKREYAKNRGNKTALIKYYDEMIPLRLEDMERKVNTELYLDGNRSGAVAAVHGLNSFLGQAGNSVNSSTGAIRSYNAADYVAAPSDTYAGLATDLGNYGGSWSGTWPGGGEGSDTYDFWSPILVNYNSTSFAGTAQTFASQCNDALRYLLMGTTKDQSEKGLIDTIILDRELMRQFKTKQDPLQRINVDRTNSDLYRLGFADVIKFDGCDVIADFGVPNACGFGLNFNHLTLRVWGDRLFETEGPFRDMDTKEYRVRVSTLFNMFADSPKYFGKLAAYTGASD